MERLLATSFSGSVFAWLDNLWRHYCIFLHGMRNMEAFQINEGCGDQVALGLEFLAGVTSRLYRREHGKSDCRR